MSLMGILDRVADVQSFDKVIEPARRAVNAALRPQVLKDLLHGTWLGHPIHPVLVQVPVPIVYDELRIEVAYRLDLLVESTVIVELKAVTRLLPIHESQLLSYLRLTGQPLGLLLNFHVPHLRDGIRRVVNGGSPRAWESLR